MNDAPATHTPDAAGSSVEPPLVIVHARKYDGRLHRTWRGRLRERRGSLIVLDAEFETEVRHPLLGTIAAGTRSIEYYWTDRWYNVFRFEHEDGTLRNFYCNVNAPAVLRGDELDFTDLDIDVLVTPDFVARILDEDEFERHSREFGYTAEVRRRAREALAELLTLISERRPPFALDPA